MMAATHSKRVINEGAMQLSPAVEQQPSNSAAPEAMTDEELAAFPMRRLAPWGERTELEQAVICERIRRSEIKLKHDWAARGFYEGRRVQISLDYRTLHPDRQRWPGREGCVVRPNSSDHLYIRLDPLPRERVEKVELFSERDLLLLPADNLPIITTFGTRIRWRTISEWLEGASAILARRCSEKQNRDVANHLHSLTKERVNVEGDPEALRNLIRFIECPRGGGAFNQLPRGQRQNDRATDLLIWGHNRLVQLSRQEAFEMVQDGPAVVRPADGAETADKHPGAFAGLAPQDRITMHLRGPYEDEGTVYGDTITGSYLTQAGLHFLVHAPAGAGGLDSKVLGPFDPDDVLSVVVNKAAAAVIQERRDRARGAPFLTWQPVDRDGFERALYEVGTEIARLRASCDGAGSVAGARDAFWRAKQLETQFDDLADQIALARTKRRFVIADAGVRLRQGRGFEPAQDCDGPLAAQQFERPLALDFSPDPAVRKDRAARRAERYDTDPVAAELDLMRRRLREQGVAARRPRHTSHLLVKVDTSAGPALWNYDLGKDGKTPTVTWGEAGKPGRAAVTRKRRSETSEVIQTIRRLAAERARELWADERRRPLRIGDEFDDQSKRWRLKAVSSNETIRAEAVDKGSLLLNERVWVRVEDFERGTGRKLAEELLDAGTEQSAAQSPPVDASALGEPLEQSQPPAGAPLMEELLLAASGIAPVATAIDVAAPVWSARRWVGRPTRSRSNDVRRRRTAPVRAIVTGPSVKRGRNGRLQACNLAGGLDRPRSGATNSQPRALVQLERVHGRSRPRAPPWNSRCWPLLGRSIITWMGPCRVRVERS